MLSLSRESAFRATREFAAPLPLVLHSPGKSGVLTFDYGWPWSEGTEICVHRLLVPKVVDQEGEDSDQDWTWKKLCLQGGKRISRILAEVMGNSTADLCDFSGVELLPRSTKKPQMFPVTMQQMPADTQHPQGCVKIDWKPTYITDLRRLKESVVAYGMHSTYVRQVKNNWAIQNRLIPQN